MTHVMKLCLTNRLTGWAPKTPRRTFSALYALNKAAIHLPVCLFLLDLETLVFHGQQGLLIAVLRFILTGHNDGGNLHRYNLVMGSKISSGDTVCHEGLHFVHQLR